ncbi:MAG: NAD-dependent epimerase/dehydratase family protein [Polyangiales bacterium]|nr:NAD-dependent epimerase/dehydratase family protein [Myxococcales bacterium]MCB9660902.1 NAD-dependent epimerase/dehydratase family protein [Sandaracinaceae bacterium]
MPNAQSHTPRNVLVTGGAGFIGSHVVRVALSEGAKVRVLIEPGSPVQNLEGLDVERVYGDLMDPPSLARAVAGCDTVFHLAAIFDYWLPRAERMFEVNVEGTVHLMEAAKGAGVQRVIKTSSIAAVGVRPGEEPADETTQYNSWATADDYIHSKYIAELEAMRFNMEGLPVVACLPTFPIGDADIRPTPTGEMVRVWVDEENPAYFGGGANFVNVKDLARGHWLAALHGRPGQRYILGGPENITFQDLSARIARATGGTPAKHAITGRTKGVMATMGRLNEALSSVTKQKPVFVERGIKFMVDNYIYFDITKAREELGYAPTSIDDGIADAVAWFQAGRSLAKRKKR